MQYSNADIIALAAAAAAGLSAFFAGWQIRANNRLNTLLKNMDVAMHCSLRYEELKKFKIDIEITRSREPNSTVPMQMLQSYYSRYWGLKNDQFDFWLNGVLDHDTFFDWSCSTALAFANESHPIDGRRGESSTLRPLRDSWEAWKRDDHGLANPMFVDFTEAILSGAVACELRDHMIREVLDAITSLEGTDRSFFRQILGRAGTHVWRKRMQRGMTWMQYKDFIEPDLTEKRKRRQNGASVGGDA
jgi:hypothetical protein